MIGWLSPLWLFAFGALALPVALHLLARGRVRRITFPSVRLLSRGVIADRRTLRFHHPLLFALRCLLLTVVALALAEPRAAVPLLGRSPAGPWLLVERELVERRPELAPQHPEAFARLDGRLEAAERVVWLASGAAPWDLWSLVREADAEAPPGVAFEIFALDRRATLVGERPSFTRPVEWTGVVPSPETVWLQRAPEPHRSLAVSPSAPPRRVVLLVAEERRSDAGYVSAALTAAAAGAELSLEVSRAEPTEWDSARVRQADLVFWLSPEAVPQALPAALADGAQLVSDATGAGRPVDSVFLPGSGGASDAVRIERMESGAPAGSELESAALWREAAGDAVLRAWWQEGVRRLHLATRFDPAWSGLAQHPSMTHWMGELLGAAAEWSQSDRRAVGAEVARPRRSERLGGAPRLPFEWPEALAWALAAVLLAMERLVASRAGEAA